MENVQKKQKDTSNVEDISIEINQTKEKSLLHQKRQRSKGSNENEIVCAKKLKTDSNVHQSEKYYDENLCQIYSYVNKYDKTKVLFRFCLTSSFLKYDDEISIVKNLHQREMIFGHFLFPITICLKMGAVN